MSDSAPERARLSAFIIAFNEAERLPRTLAALHFADEIVVVDSGSSDGTVTVAETFGARVDVRPFDGYGPQKAHAEALCSHDWLLNVDADEEVSPSLASEIEAILATARRPEAYRLKINTVYPGDVVPRRLAADYTVVRFYHRRIGRYRAHPLFDRVELDAGVVPGTLRAPVYHHAFTSWSNLVAKLNAYTSYNAREAEPRPRAVLVLRLVVEMPVVFFKAYVLRRHVLGGWKGFAFAAVQAFFRLMRIVKMLEEDERRRAEGASQARGKDATSALTRPGAQP